MADCKKIVITEKAPKAIGPYSVGIVTEQFVFTSGQIGLDPLTGDFVAGGIEIKPARHFKILKRF
jgi:2-iminobutanoate/2-iminopropanoate deaminase